MPHLHNPADPHAAQSWFTGLLWSHTHAHTGLGSNPSLNRSWCLPLFAFPESGNLILNNVDCPAGGGKNMMQNQQQIKRGVWELGFFLKIIFGLILIGQEKNNRKFGKERKDDRQQMAPRWKRTQADGIRTQP